MVDTHSHLYLKQFNKDIDDVISRALSAGVHRFYMPSINSSYNKDMLQLMSRYPENIFCMIGLHPCYVDLDYKKELDFVREEIKKNKYYAIGEIGIDLYHEKKFLKEQIIAFEEQIDLAIRYDLPIVIHCRESFNEIYDVLKKFKSKNLRGIFHCFSGSIEEANKIVDLNFSLGIGGVVTFKNGMISEFLNQIPIEKIVLETDSPYLAPVPYRGKRNESSYIEIIAKKISEIYDVDLDYVSKITDKKALDIFGS